MRFQVNVHLYPNIGTPAIFYHFSKRILGRAVGARAKESDCKVLILQPSQALKKM